MPSWSDRLRALPTARFRPRLLDDLPGYDRRRFVADAAAGITVGIVALPLAMAFAIASGLKPEQGLVTAVIAGFLISALGGSSVQIGGPAGAFVVVVYAIVERYGLANLLISSMLAGVLLFLMGWLKLGALVRFLPVGIVIGFTNGIAVLIAVSQVRDLLGLVTPKPPADFFSQIGLIARYIDTVNPYACAIGLVCFGGLFLWPKLWSRKTTPLPPQWIEGRAARMAHAAARTPGPFVALVTATLATVLLQLPVDTLGSRFGSIPQHLPAFDFPEFDWPTAKLLLAPTLTLALLGAVESLLCARVADRMREGPRHDPNQELMAQGIANFVTPWFGGMPATGTIARTSTNVRAGATSPVAGMLHAATVLALMLVAAPLALHVPLAALAGILMYVAWNMGEWHEFARLRQFKTSYRVVLVGSFVLTVVFDLTVAVEVGLVLACGFFIVRMAQSFRVDAPPAPALPEGVALRKLHGALFFGAVGKLETLSASLPEGTWLLVLDAHRLISLDSTGVDAIGQLHRDLQRRGIALVLCELDEQPRSLLERSGIAAQLGAGAVVDSLDQALAGAARAPNPAVT
jgi:sulfate permease, SulP family